MNGRNLVIDLVDGGPGHRTVVLQGDLDSSTAGEFDDRVSQGCPAWKGDAVVVDLSGLEYISSAGVRSLLRLERMLGAGTLHLEGATGIVRDVLETTGILQPEDQAIVERSLAQVGGMEFADRPFSAISDGQRQRILLARALCQEPEIIVLDEPTSFLDIRYKLELLTVLKRMVRENDLAVLLSLHELELAERISDTVVCVAGDRIDRIGPPEEIFTRAYIAKLYRMEHGKYDPCFDSLEFVP